MNRHMALPVHREFSHRLRLSSGQDTTTTDAQRLSSMVGAERWMNLNKECGLGCIGLFPASANAGG
jgi:hypothetical protein